jgi:hypothetical protein
MVLGFFLFYKKIMGFLKDVYEDDDEDEERGRKKLKESSI